MQSTSQEVVVPPASRDLTTLDVLREELEITDHKSDARLARWIHDASEQVVDFLGRDLAEQTTLETFFQATTFHTRVAHRLLLRQWPVTAVNSIVIDGISWDPSFYLVRKPQGEVVNLDMYGRPSVWRGYRIEVNYTAGFELIGALPRAIERATLLLLRSWFAARSRDPSLRSESVAGIVTQTWFDPTAVRAGAAMPPEAAALLEPFKERFI